MSETGVSLYHATSGSEEDTSNRQDGAGTEPAEPILPQEELKRKELQTFPLNCTETQNNSFPRRNRWNRKPDLLEPLRRRP